MNKVKVIITQDGYRLFLENIDVLYYGGSENYPSIYASLSKFEIIIWLKSGLRWVICDNIPTKDKAEKILEEVESFMMSDNETKLDFRNMYPIETGDKSE